MSYDYTEVAEITFVGATSEEHSFEILLFDKELTELKITEEMFIYKKYPVLLRLDGVLLMVKDQLFNYLLDNNMLEHSIV